MAAFAGGHSAPVTVLYCGVCTLPLEYCSYGPPAQQPQCRAWAEENCPEEHEALQLREGVQAVKVTDGEGGGGAAGEGGAEGKPAAAAAADGDGGGGGGAAAAAEAEPKRSTAPKKPKPKKEASAPMVKIGRVSRNKRKFITIVGGLGAFPDIKLKDAAKLMGRQFACGCGVNKTASGAEEITIQGDVLHDLPAFLESAFHIPHDRISVVGE